MEELDYEDVLSIHPEEDLKKSEPIETDAGSPLEEAIETDANSNLEPTIEIEANSPLEAAIETDVDSCVEPDIETDTNSCLDRLTEADANSSLERVKETDANSNLEVAIETDANSNLKHGIETDVNSNEKQAIETDANSNLEQASDSDSGEIDDDEEANDLEEGEIKENSTVLKKKSDIACRFFKRGSCVFGSQCQYLHVSDTVYKMFETNPQKRKDLQPVEHQHQHFIKPIIFSSNVLPPRPFIEPPISVAPKADFPRQYDSLEDNWERCLEQARILVQRKRKFTEVEPRNFNSKNNGSEMVKGQYFTNDLPLANNKKYGEKTFPNNSLRRADAFDEKKSNNRYQPRSSDKWVDPWRRSKSRQRSRSSSHPSRTRKHSYSSSFSSSSSSSEIGDIYKRSYKKRSPPGGRVSKSRSISQPRQSKKRRISPKHSFNGRRDLRSSSRSASRSPSRKRHSPSRSRTSSSSSSSSSDREVSPTPADKEMQRISAKLSEQFHKSVPSRASSVLRSDCETSELTVSSASCTSLSSDSETESPRRSPSLRRKQSPIRNNTSSFSSKTTSLANPKVSYRSESNLLKSRNVVQRKNDAVPSFPKKMQPHSGGKNQNDWNSKTESTDCKPKNAASAFNSGKKPALESSKNKRSADMNLLFMYQDLRGSNKNNEVLNLAKGKPSNSALKPNKTDNAEKVANKANSNSETSKKVSKPRVVPNHDMDMLFIYQGLGNAKKNSINAENVKTNNPPLKPNKTNDDVKVADKANICPESHKKLSNVTKQNIVLNLQPKSKGSWKPEIPTKAPETVTVQKKVVTSKREKLLNKLKLIDDAIARKKCKF